jgi:hypothetical protein
VVPNIGPREQKRRLLIAAGAFFLAAVVAAALIALDAPRGFRVLMFPLFWLGGVGVYQVRLRTCVHLAAKGVCNLDGGEVPITDPDELAAVRAQARRVHIYAILLATLLTVASLSF